MDLYQAKTIDGRFEALDERVKWLESNASVLNMQVKEDLASLQADLDLLSSQMLKQVKQEMVDEDHSQTHIVDIARAVIRLRRQANELAESLDKRMRDEGFSKIYVEFDGTVWSVSNAMGSIVENALGPLLRPGSLGMPAAKDSPDSGQCVGEGERPG